MQRDESCPNSQRRGPLVLQDVQADGARLRANVGVPDLRVEFHLWGLERVIWRNLYVHIEDSSLIAGVLLLIGLVVCQYIFPSKKLG